jgi:hypothetical protein
MFLHGDWQKSCWLVMHKANSYVENAILSTHSIPVWNECIAKTWILWTHAIHWMGGLHASNVREKLLILSLMCIPQFNVLLHRCHFILHTYSSEENSHIQLSMDSPWRRTCSQTRWMPARPARHHNRHGWLAPKSTVSDVGLGFHGRPCMHALKP